MNKNKYFIILFLTIKVSFASDTTKDFNEMYQHYFDGGYNKCLEEVYPLALKKAKEELEKKLLKYKERHDAREAGKYLMKKGKITYPEVVKIPDNKGNFKFIIKPPKIEDELSIEDIWNIPTEKKSNDKDINNKQNIENKKNKFGFSTPSERLYSKKNYTSYSNNNYYKTVNLNKSKNNISVADDMALNYKLNPKSITLNFNTKEQYIDYCKKTTGGDPKCYELD